MKVGPATVPAEFKRVRGSRVTRCGVRVTRFELQIARSVNPSIPQSLNSLSISS